MEGGTSSQIVSGRTAKIRPGATDLLTVAFNCGSFWKCILSYGSPNVVCEHLEISLLLVELSKYRQSVLFSYELRNCV